MVQGWHIPHSQRGPRPHPAHSPHQGGAGPPAAGTLGDCRCPAPPGASNLGTVAQGGSHLGQKAAQHPLARHPLQRHCRWVGVYLTLRPPPQNKWAWSHLRLPRGLSGSQGQRCCSAAVWTAACPNPPASGLVQQHLQHCLWGTAGGSAAISNPKPNPLSGSVLGQIHHDPTARLSPRCPHTQTGDWDLPVGVFSKAKSWWLSNCCRGKQDRPEALVLWAQAKEEGCNAPVAAPGPLPFCCAHPITCGWGCCRGASDTGPPEPLSLGMAGRRAG